MWATASSPLMPAKPTTFIRYERYDCVSKYAMVIDGAQDATSTRKNPARIDQLVRETVSTQRPELTIR